MLVRDADLDKDRRILLQFLREHLPLHAGEEYFDWLYRQNPHGRARAWVAIDEDNDSVLGTAAAFPRKMRVRGEELLAWNLGDFAIRKDQRSLGPALQLQRACLGPVLEGGMPFAYDHPSCNMMAIYKRMGITTAARVVRFAKPLRVDDKMDQLIKPKALARGVSGLGNVILSLVDRDLSRRGPHRARILTDRFDQRVDELDRRLGSTCGVAGVRSAEYLNWRYLDHPLRKHEAMVIEDGEHLLGYAIYRVEDAHAVLADLFAEDRDLVPETLIRAVTAAARQAHAQTLSAPVLEHSRLVAVLERCGFRPRESATFVVSTKPGSRWDGVVTDASNWFHCDGDRDG